LRKGLKPLKIMYIITLIPGLRQLSTCTELVEVCRN
jgi:hypothetical protein